MRDYKEMGLWNQMFKPHRTPKPWRQSRKMRPKHPGVSRKVRQLKVRCG